MHRVGDRVSAIHRRYRAPSTVVRPANGWSDTANGRSHRSGTLRATALARIGGDHPAGARTDAATHHATITWAPPGGDRGAAVTGYRIARDGVDSHGTGPWSTTVPDATRTFTFGSLKPGATYHLTVQAINAAGTGPAATATVTTPAA